MILQNLISTILYSSFVIYAMFGAYSLTLNKEARLNRIFALLCFCLAWWGFAFAVTNSAGSYEAAMLFRRMSVMGWGVAYSLILHFVIVLTESNWSQKKKQPLLMLVLYVPAALNVILFGFYSKTATTQIQLVSSIAGWSTIAVNNALDNWFLCYYLGFSLVALFLLLQWHQDTRDLINKKKALYLIISFSVALILGSFTDILANGLFSLKLPSLAPLIIMIPVATIFHIIHKYELLIPKAQINGYSEGVILSMDSRTKLFKFTGIVLAIGSIINFSVRIVISSNREIGVLFSFVLVIVSVFVILIPYLVKTIKYQEGILAALLLITLPVVMLVYQDGSFSNLIWPVPIFVIMLTVIFNNKRIFYSVAVLSMFLGIIFWVRIPNFDVEIGTSAEVFRLLFYIIGISLTALISSIYVYRLKENKKQEDYQKIIAEISTNFLMMTLADFDTQVENLLKKSGTFINADRGTVVMFSSDFQTDYCTHEWVTEGKEMVIEKTAKKRIPALSGSKKKLLGNAIVYQTAGDSITPGSEQERALFASQHIQDMICIPIQSKDKVIGFIRFDQFTTGKSWELNDPELLRILANILADAFAKVKTEKDITYLAYYDTLTDLPNRVLFRNRLEQAIDLAKGSVKSLGVIFIDIDGFKEVNDTLGHDWGDHLLNRIGRRLSDSIRKYDTVARFGGDEFLIMVPQLSRKEDLEAVAKKIMAVFHHPIAVEEQEFYITASAGIAVFPDDGENVNNLIKHADLAMYAAKKNGKGQYAFCTKAMKDDVLEKMSLTNSLYRALERNELHLYYQPQVDVVSQEIIGFEALLRWEHPKLGPISPVVFIPIAEETGLINSIGEWVLMTACAQNKEWQDRGFKPVQMGVNLSVEQFRSGNLERIVKACLEKTGLEPQYLELEITESIAMKESGYVAKCLHALKALGVAISIDDFGTEFSSLSRLKDLPVNRLKIDMQFIKGITVNPKDESIIAVMIHLAKRLGLKIIAEGVETEVQLGFLRAENCDEIQGYYYYKPLSKNEIDGSIYKD